MTADVFIDSSALVALLLGEPGSDAIADRIVEARRRRTSPVAMLETVMVLSTRAVIEPAGAASRLADLLQSHDIEVVPVDSACADRAIIAFSHYGKGRHPARLNLGDCISYACAKENGLSLLYKGDDFAKTDLAYDSCRRSARISSGSGTVERPCWPSSVEDAAVIG